MLVFGADISDPAAVGRPGRESRDGVEAFLIWTPIIIDNGLSEYITVCKRLTTYSGGSSIYRFNTRSKFPAPVDIIELFSKFPLQQPKSVFVASTGVFKLIPCLGHQTCAFQA